MKKLTTQQLRLLGEVHHLNGSVYYEQVGGRSALNGFSDATIRNLENRGLIKVAWECQSARYKWQFAYLIPEKKNLWLHLWYSHLIEVKKSISSVFKDVKRK